MIFFNSTYISGFLLSFIFNQASDYQNDNCHDHKPVSYTHLAGIGVASGFCFSADLDFGVDLDFDVDADFDFAVDFSFSVGVTVRVFGAGGPAASVPWTFENIQTATILSLIHIFLQGSVRMPGYQDDAV